MRSSMIMLIFVALLVVLLTSCASRQSAGTAMPAKSYRQILQRQRSLQAERQTTLKELPEMTAADYGIAGDNHLRLGNLTAAFIQYDKALRLDPNMVHIRYKKACLLLQRRLIQSAIQEFESVIKDHPDYFLAYEGLGQAHLFKSELKTAETYLKKAISLNDQLWKSYNFLGIIYDKRQDYNKAISFYKKAIEISPKESILYNNIGISLYRNQDFEKASEYFKKALQYDASNKKVYNNLGMALANMGHYEDAIKTFTKSGGLAKAYNNIGVIYLKKGIYKKAITAFEKAIELNPNFYTKANENLILTRQMLNPTFDTSTSR